MTVGETQWVRVSFPDSGRRMGRALILPVIRIVKLELPVNIPLPANIARCLTYITILLSFYTS